MQFIMLHHLVRCCCRGDSSSKSAGLLASGDDRNQYFPGQRRDVTYISRLQAVQAAITTQINLLKETVSTVSFLDACRTDFDGVCCICVAAPHSLAQGNIHRINIRTVHFVVLSILIMFS